MKQGTHIQTKAQSSQLCRCQKGGQKSQFTPKAIVNLNSQGEQFVYKKASIKRSRGLTITNCSVFAVDERLQQYNAQMKERMGWSDLNPYEYHFDRGLYFHEVYHNLICGSQPRSAVEVEQLVHDVGVTAIVNLQQDKDPQYWGINLHEIVHKAHKLGIKFVRTSVRDFDPDSLRRHLPEAAMKVHQLLEQGERVYVHCTAGLGRAPAVCIAWMYWFTDMDLDTAYQYLTTIRPCGPKRDAIRAATYDLLYQAEIASNGHNGHYQNFDHLPDHAFAHVTPEEKDMIRGYLLTQYSMMSQN